MAKTIGDLPLLALVRDDLTKYAGVPIVWRLGDKNHPGYPANAASLISRDVVKSMAFDGKEPGHGWTEDHGFSRYRLSNLRQWANKDSLPWFEKTYSYDQPPDAAHVTANPYDGERGFLSNFSPQLRGLLMDTTIYVLESGNNLTMTDKVFILSETEAGFGGSEGTKWAGFTDDASRSIPGGTSFGPMVMLRTMSTLDNQWNKPDHAVKAMRGDGSSNGWSGPNAEQGTSAFRPCVNIPLNTKVSDTPDSDGVYTITWNDPPTPPSSISVTGTIMTGKPVTATWGKSTDPDGDAVTYELERAVNGGSFTRVYTGTALTHTETAGADWDAVQYRVRAADNKGATGGYVSSPVYSVIHNADPTISGTDADIGAVTAPPSHSYQVDDADAGDTLTVVEQLDGKAVRTIGNATRGTTYTFALTRGQFFSLAHGQHRMGVTVTDSKGGTASRSVTFSRNVAGIDFDVNPRETDARPEQIIVNLRCVADENDVDIQVCNNALDASPAWEPASPGLKHIFTNTAKTAAKWAVAVRIRAGKSEGFEQVICYAPSCAFK